MTSKDRREASCGTTRSTHILSGKKGVFSSFDHLGEAFHFLSYMHTASSFYRPTAGGKKEHKALKIN